MMKSPFKKLLLISLTLLLISPTTAFAQLSKTPSLTGEVPVLVTQDPFILPEDYPQEILDHFEKNIDARSYIVIDSQTNRVLAEGQGNTRYPIASMSKVAAIYLVYQAIKDEKIKMNDKIKIPQEIEDYMSFNPEMSAMGLHANVEYTIEELIHGVMLMSGNDATSALMWHIYGSEQDAVKAIRELLTSWGMTNFEFYTTSGIPNQYLPESLWIEGSSSTSENHMTAADVALMAQHMVKDFPEITKVTSATSYVAKEGTEYEIIMSNPNMLLPGGTYARENITGLKSGMTDAAGKNFVATGVENGRDIIAVAMGVFDTATMEMSSFWEIEILLNKLAEYPDLYKNEALPTNIHEIPAPEELISAESTEETTSDEDLKALLEAQGISGENRRNNPITNFIKGIFDIFK